MKLSPFEYGKLFLFLLVFGSMGLLSISQYGYAIGITSTLLAWSFYLLCIPISGNALITSFILSLFIKKSFRYPGIITWLFAITLNIVIYFTAPYMYLSLTTTHFLYQIISTPWPYWLIIGISSLGGIYNALIIQPHKKNLALTHQFVKFILFTVGIIVLFYLSYIDLIVMLSSKLH